MLATDRQPAHALVAKVERLLARVEELPDAAARGVATDLVAALLDLYGAALERMVEAIAARDDGSAAEELAGDELVAHVLMLHGLHPVPVQERVLAALADVRPFLESHGGDVELVSVEDAEVHLRLQGSCSGCPSSQATLKLAIEEAIHKAAPEIERVVAQDAPRPPELLQIEWSSCLPRV
jgi:Fe-S cluster biogenesis protein NfuA